MPDTPAMDSAGTSIQASPVRPPSTILSHHQFFTGLYITAGLSRYPTTGGHTQVVVHSAKHDLFSLDLNVYMHAMSEIRQVAQVLRDYYGVARCALVTDGSSTVSIIPLHGLKRNWEPVTGPRKEFHEYFPGYVSSMDGPQMDASRLRDICTTIQKVSGISTTPLDYRFDGDPSDQNLFARLVRGEIPQSRVWEDEQHVAFLTPFANTPGFTVLVPRAHLPSDIFSLEPKEYASLVRSTYTIAQDLKSALGLVRCGMILEGFEIDYAHVKLIPIIHDKREEETQEETLNVDGPTAITHSVYEENYAGYVTSQPGPLVKDDDESLSLDAVKLRAMSQAYLC